MPSSIVPPDDKSARATPPDWTNLWRLYGQDYVQRTAQIRHATIDHVEHELLFCLLGGYGVSYELARSAARRVSELDVFSTDWSEETLRERLEAELRRAQFLPLKSDGTQRRYRFPKRKARLISRAANWVIANRPILDMLQVLDQEEERRIVLCECPGVGLKTASWLLRNAGLADRLAVLDIHVVRAMQSTGRLRNVRLPQDYLRVEKLFLSWCDQLTAPPAAFDLLLWEWLRASIRE